MQPAINLPGRDGSGQPRSKLASEPIEPLAQVGKVNSGLALRFPDGEEFLNRRFDGRRMAERFNVRKKILNSILEADSLLASDHHGAPFLGCDLAIAAPFVEKLDLLFCGECLGRFLVGKIADDAFSTLPVVRSEFISGLAIPLLDPDECSHSISMQEVAGNCSKKVHATCMQSLAKPLEYKTKMVCRTGSRRGNNMTV